MDKGNRNLTILGMILTVCISISGTWVTNMVSLGKNQTEIQQLIKNDVENKTVNTLVYKLESKVENLSETQIKRDSEITNLTSRVNSNSVNNAKTAQALENLVDATNKLTETTGDLVIAVAKLEK